MNRRRRHDDDATAARREGEQRSPTFQTQAIREPRPAAACAVKSAEPHPPSTTSTYIPQIYPTNKYTSKNPPTDHKSIQQTMHPTLNPLLSIDPMLPTPTIRRPSTTTTSSTSTDGSDTRRYSLPSPPIAIPRRNLPVHTREVDRRSTPNFGSTPSHQMPSQRPRTPIVNTPSSSALASPASPPPVFPAALNRTPPPSSRSQSRPVPSSSSRSSASPVPARRAPVVGRASLDGTRLSPPPAVEALDRSYSPMAASFARLGRQGDGGGGTGGVGMFGSSMVRGRSAGVKSSLELEARLFAGPA